MLIVDSSIFKAYDIRGLYPEQLREETAELIARAYAALLSGESPGKKLKVLVGMDMRLSSPSLKEVVVKGLLESGIDVDDVGLLSTPTFYYGVGRHGYDGGIQVTASHNPKEWNGIKLVRSNGRPVSKDTGIYAIRDMILEDRLPAPAAVPGSYRELGSITEEATDEFVAMHGTSAIRPFTIVIDPANAMGILDMTALFRKLPCKVIEMNYVLDGTFPAHEADPLKFENLRDLSERVRAEHADLGIATDGDNDRIFFVDDQGGVVPPHVARGILSAIELEAHPGAKIVYDIRPGRITKDMIEAAGGTPVVGPVGHSLLKEVMAREGAVFGGESSGHFFYQLPWGTFEAPMLVVLKLLTWLSAKGAPLSEAIAPYMKYAHSGEINIRVPDRATVERKIEELKVRHADGTQLFIDGITVEHPEYWFNVRAANTEPVMRLTVEAVNAEVLAKETEALRRFLAE